MSMENLVKSLGLLKSREQDYVEIKNRFYANYKGNCIVIGYRCAKHNFRDEIIVCSEICYAYRFDPEEEAFDVLDTAIKQASIKPSFYHDYNGNDELLRSPQKYGYAEIHDIRNLDKSSFEESIEREKKKFKDLNKLSLAMVLSELKSDIPLDIYEYKNYEKRERILKLMSEWECLLLFEDQEVRELYIQKKRFLELCWSNYMSIHR
ncbi:hypothetical protein [Butyrivibrio sp. NC2007]|uniref:hypothetical protein n=1 Tax=Butyrivibrio sp. NC2007 TaxID=1280683 RepID=UPI0003B6C8C9|nr:hypothetical protein [Butyrivibrio sp. NC2007]